MPLAILLYAGGRRVDPPSLGIPLALVGLVLIGWFCLGLMSERLTNKRAIALAIPAFFGAWLLYIWQFAVVGYQIPQILLPAPSQIAHQLIAQASTLWLDFQQTFLKSVLTGFALGCGIGFAVAILTDRVPFLQRGLLPLGNLASAVPIVGIAPIMVMWFGFGWESKVAVIVVMTFFPMLINTIAGLAAADPMELDLMRSYGAGYWQILLKLRLPAALPFVFNALKINSTLALIGAIVSEMFGSPIYGMGFRISTEAYKMNTDIAWATIAVAAMAGSMFYGLLALLERRLTFWHPSYRSKPQS
jgi:NitT/TauT family transport system permease protein